MDRMQLVYAILNVKMPTGYRNVKGLKLINKLKLMSNDELSALYKELTCP